MSQQIDSRLTARFKIAIALTAVTLAAEVAGGIWTNSLALLSDAAHCLSGSVRPGSLVGRSTTGPPCPPRNGTPSAFIAPRCLPPSSTARRCF